MKRRMSLILQPKLKWAAACVALLFLAGPGQATRPALRSLWGGEFHNVGDEPRAAGQAWLTDMVLVDEHWEEESVCDWGASAIIHYKHYTATLNVECRRLTRDATYWTPVGTFTSPSGPTTISGNVDFEVASWQCCDHWGCYDRGEGYIVEVIRLDEDGSATPVLSRGFPRNPMFPDR
jgi:hypothetical protein